MPQSEQTAAVTAAQTLQREGIDPKEARARVTQLQEEWEQEMSRRRRFLYADVEELIGNGFLTHLVRIGPLDISLRSLSPGDLFLLGQRCGRDPTDRLWKTWAVGSSIWMVDGMNLLEDQDSASRMFHLVQHFPTRTLDILFSNVLGLINRASTALSRVEAYCYEMYSRASWRMCGRTVPSHAGVSGVPGVARLGLNHVQRMWVAFNLSEDDREVMHRDWQAAKLVASAMSPKGVKKLNAADERLEKRETTRRAEAILRMVNQVLYGEAGPEDQPWRLLIEGQPVDVVPVKTARTDEELAEQFRRMVAGEKDWHDLVVDTYKERIRQRFDGEKREREALLADAAGTRKPGVTGGTGVVGYTLDQLKELRASLFSPRPGGGKRVFDSGAPAAVYQKWVQREVTAGRLQADEAGVYEVEKDQEGPSLQEQVASRKPVFSTEPMRRPPTRGGD